MTVGKKIGWGFTALMVLMGIVGGIAVLQMRGEARSSEKLATETVPEAAIASSIERSVLELVFGVRGYLLTYDAKSIAVYRKSLEETKTHLQEAARLAQEHPDLVQLKSAAEEGMAAINEYDKLLEEQEKYSQAFVGNRVEMNSLLDRLSKTGERYIAEARKGFAAESAKGPEADVRKLQLYQNQEILAGDVIARLNRIAFGAYRAEVSRNDKALSDLLPEFQKVADSVEGLAQIADSRTQADVGDMRSAAKQLEELSSQTRDNLAGISANNERRRIVYTKVLELANTLSTERLKLAVEVSTKSSNDLNWATNFVAIGVFCALVTGAFLAFFIARGISRAMTEIIKNLAAASEQINAAAAEQSRGGQVLAQGASEQASSLEETSASLEELSSMTAQNEENTRAAKEKANKASDVATSGRSAMGELQSAIDRIKESAQQTAAIIKAIDEIAFQTNLLALNAAVEAARAGDSGKGFAVVADEVRSLAQRSAQAAKNTGELIQVSQTNAEQGVSVVGQVTKILESIVQEVESVAALINEVASASVEQTTGLKQINTAVTEMDKVTQSAAATAEQSAAASEELSAQAKELNEVVDVLREMIVGTRQAQVSEGSFGRVAHTTSERKYQQTPRVSVEGREELRKASVIRSEKKSKPEQNPVDAMSVPPEDIFPL